MKYMLFINVYNIFLNYHIKIWEIYIIDKMSRKINKRNTIEPFSHLSINKIGIDEEVVEFEDHSIFLCFDYNQVNSIYNKK